MSGRLGLTQAQINHILAARANMLAGRTQQCILISQSNNPIASATPGLAIPNAPTITDSGAGGTFGGGTVYAQAIALNQNGQTLPCAETGPVPIAAGHTIHITAPNTTNATSIRLYASTASGAETYQGAVAPGATLTISAPLDTTSETTPYYSYTLINAIIRHERGVNPQNLDETGSGADRRLMSILFEAYIAQNMDGAKGGMLAETTTPTPAATNTPGTATYTFIDLVSTGLVPGGDRWLGMLRRNQ